MATLVLSTVGTLLGGPIGGAIGSLVGQSIDQQIFGSPRRGPRLGDLSVQTSSYGTQVPRIYGTMRVAGSVIWSTDLVESSQTSGAKGQPDTVYSYSVSFAVALSSRPLLQIRRIWADGKLLRGESGDFKVSTDFRFYDGLETQDVDPLIASLEGLDNTPAYRGLALAVFEHLELAEYGNRIPFLTFEVVADASAPQLGSVLGDASDGLIDCQADTPVMGYAATGRTMREALEPLVESFAVDLVEEGAALRSPAVVSPITVSDDELGCTCDGRAAPRSEREQAPARSLPASLMLSYYDPQRDYLTGQARSEAIGEAPTEAKVELPAVLAAEGARALAEQIMARQWTRKDKLTVRLPPRFMTLEPGVLLDLPASPTRWQVERLTVDGMVTIAELRPAWRTMAELPADAGRLVAPADIVAGELTLALVELPELTGAATSVPMAHLAASAATPGWKAVPIAVSAGAFTSTVRVAGRKAVMGATMTPLADGQARLLDAVNAVDVRLIDEGQWLTSCDDEALAGGTNLALIGDELVQFGSAVPIGPGEFRLTRLLRGRAGTEWAIAGHASGDLFLLISQASLLSIPLPSWARGSVLTAQSSTGAMASRLVDLRSVRPPAPVNLSAIVTAAGDLQLGWTRRSRAGFAWLDDIDAPIREQSELYAVTVSGLGGSIDVQSPVPFASILSSELEAVGPGIAQVSVRQIGDWAASVPLEATVTLP